MKINNTEIAAGENKKVKIRVGYLPSGTEINLFAHVYRAKEEGPTGLILAGIHGDEINGVETLRRMIDSKLFESLKKGTVIVVPLLNVFGFINFSREVPDGKDVNRSFPGNNRGSLASRVARKLTKSILPLVDFGIDLHTGSDSRHNHPQVRYTTIDAKSKELAIEFNAPYTIAKARIPKTLRKVATQMGKPMLVFEGGESKRLDAFSIERASIGIKNVLCYFDILDQNHEAERIESIEIKRTTWVRAAEAGIFIWSKCSGFPVEKGEHLGVIEDVQGKRSINVIAPKSGHIIGHNNAPVVNSGDALFHIGSVD